MKHILIVLISCFIFSCDTNEKSDDNGTIRQSQSTIKMIDRLNTIVNNLDPMSSRFMNNEKLLILEEITELKFDRNNLQSINLLANEHLNTGNSQKAADLFNKVLEFM